jgi:hypothetical protein
MRVVLMLLTTTIAGGCQLVTTDSYCPSITAKDVQLSVGMERAEAERAIQQRVIRVNDHVLGLPDHFGGGSPFDSRSVYLYFDDNKLAAIIVRGSYIVWW